MLFDLRTSVQLIMLRFSNMDVLVSFQYCLFRSNWLRSGTSIYIYSLLFLSFLHGESTVHSHTLYMRSAYDSFSRKSLWTNLTLQNSRKRRNLKFLWIVYFARLQFSSYTLVLFSEKIKPLKHSILYCICIYCIYVLFEFKMNIINLQSLSANRVSRACFLMYVSIILIVLDALLQWLFFCYFRALTVV